MLGTVALDLGWTTDTKAPDSPSGKLTGTSPAATSSFDLVQRANAGDQEALDTLCRALPAQAATVGPWPDPPGRPQRAPNPRSRARHTAPGARTATYVQTTARGGISGVRPDGAVEPHPRHRPPVPADRSSRPTRHRNRGTRSLAPRHCDRSGDARSLRGGTRSLRPEEKELIIARIEMGLPHAEIAAMFDKPSVAAVHMALSRALVKLAEEMAHERKR